jgi:hypothetical protein
MDPMTQTPMSIPPPPSKSQLVMWIFGAVLALSLGAGIAAHLIGASRVLFIAQMGLLAVTICAIPTLVYRFLGEGRRLARVATETLLFGAVLVGFGVWIFGAPILGIWIAYTVGVILLLEVGGHIVEWHLISTLERLSQSGSFTAVQSAAGAVKRMFHHEVILYIPVPLGIVVGTFVGLIRRQTAQETVTFCLQLVLLGASLVLLCFLVYAFARMCDTLFEEASTTSIPSIHEGPLRRSGGPKGKALKAWAPMPKTKAPTEKQKVFDIASVATDLRKVYLYDALHNFILLAVFVAITVQVWAVTPGVVPLIVATIVGAFGFNQLPYMIGQSRLRQELLRPYRDSERRDVDEELTKYAPLLPKWEFLSVLLTPLSAGGALYFLLGKLMENALK